MKIVSKSITPPLTALIIVFLIPGKLIAQNLNRDSLKRIAVVRDSLKQDSLTRATKIKITGGADGRRQVLNAAQTRQFLANKNNSTSDLFKPKAGFVSDTTLLFDSVYVKAFRLSAYQRALGDNSNTLKCYWGSFAIGASSTGGACLNINGNAELPRQQLITLEGQLDAKGFLFGPYTDIASASVLYGHIFKDKYALYTISGGIGVVNVQTSTEGLFYSSVTNQTSACVPIVARAYHVFGQVFGLGVGGYVNLNAIQTTAGINLSFAFGRLTTHERDANYKPRQRPRLFGNF